MSKKPKKTKKKGSRKKLAIILAIAAAVILCILYVTAWPYIRRHYIPVRVDRQKATQMSAVDLGDQRILTVQFTRVGNSDFEADVDAVSSASLMKDGDMLVGNSELLADMITAAVGGDQYAIRTVKKYPSGYGETTQVALQELRTGEQAELAGELPDLSGYDTVFLVYPIWWNTIPKAVEQFLAQTDTDGVTIYPVITHGGSKEGGCLAAMKEAVSESVIAESFLTVYDDEVDTAAGQVQKWLERLSQ